MARTTASHAAIARPASRATATAPSTSRRRRAARGAIRSENDRADRAVSFLSDAEIAAALTYARASFGNQLSPVAPDEVAKVRGQTASAP